VEFLLTKSSIYNPHTCHVGNCLLQYNLTELTIKKFEVEIHDLLQTKNLANSGIQGTGSMR
jgi:hypothetical protein